ncbi:invasin [Ferrimonas sp. SCSIO 43195]|uniref:invasin n=1 Tax=Ferrimonas sp. SCSIO 43195 TaxID=2822844 RepID=UPI0020751AEE|nr:invasin [Ferrimonas sp. SCSIO 43195]USD38696.1 invasin [Ferrimonas sp. SCSIO 43195]
MQLLDSSGNPIQQIPQGESVQASALLLADNLPVSGRAVAFSATSSAMEQPIDAQMTTDEQGQARLLLPAGSLKGSGQVSVSYGTSAQASRDFNVASLAMTLSLVGADGADVRIVSAGGVGRLRARITDNGEPQPFVLVSFRLDSVGALNPGLGTALTDADGIAQVTLLPGVSAGAGLVFASAEHQGTTLSQSLSFSSLGDDAGDGSVGGQLQLTLTGSVSGNPTTRVSAAEPGLISVRVLDEQQQPVVSRVVSFSSGLGNLLPASGTALTDSDGRASILLQAGSVQGAAELEASFNGQSARLGFVTLGDEIDPALVVPDIQVQLYDCQDSPGWDRNLKNFEACTSTTNITNTRAGIIGIEVTQSGGIQPLAQRLVSATTSIGAVSPAAGTAITNAQGRALLDLYADGDVGAGELTVSLQNQSHTLAFEVGRVSVDLDVQTRLGKGALPAGGSTIIEVRILNGDGSLALDQPLQLELSSQCMSAGLAHIDTPITTVAGVGLATYRAAGCQGQDLISVSAKTGGSTVVGETEVEVSAAAIGSLQFLEVSSSLLALKGTGGIQGGGLRSETSVVRFRLLDRSGNPAGQQRLCFELSTNVGGLSLSPDPLPQDLTDCPNIDNSSTELTQYAVGDTDANGEVAVTVGAGTVATPVKVFALWSDPQNRDIVIANVSDNLVITTGLADDNSTSLSASVLNPEALSIDSQEVDIHLLAADHFNNPVPDGTAVTFRAEGGAIDGSCITGPKDDRPNPSGGCSVQWRSQNARPFYDGAAAVCPDGSDATPPCLGATLEAHYQGVGSVIAEPRPGRATVMAMLIGEESFVDLNGNGLFDGAPETFVDLTEAFMDDNEDGRYRNYQADGLAAVGSVPAGAVNEEFVDYDGDEAFDGVDGVYTGLLCHPEASSQCVDTGLDLAKAQLHLRRNLTLVMSGSVPYGKLRQWGSGGSLNPVSALDLVTNSKETVLLFLSDANNNPLPYGTTITASTSNGELVGATQYTMGSSNSMIPLVFSFTVERETNPNGRSEGTLSILVQTPLGNPASFSVAVEDGG